MSELHLHPGAEQAPLAEAARRYLRQGCSPEARRGRIGNPAAQRAAWRGYAEMGWLGCMISAESGGIGGTVEDALAIAREFGRVLAPEPFSAAMQSACLIQRLGTAAQQAALLPALADGSRIFAVAGPQAGTIARQVGAGWQVSGRFAVVPGGALADCFLIAAHTGQRGVFLLGPDQPGVTRRSFELHDGSAAAELMLADVALAEDARLGSADASAALAATQALGVALRAADAIGAMEEALDLARAYLKTRTQFGTTLASFQSLQHIIADMAVELNQAEAMLRRLVHVLHHADAGECEISAGAAKAFIARAARFVTAQAIQLHGGIGMTEEHRVGACFKRAVVFDLLGGSAATHIAAWAAHQAAE